MTQQHQVGTHATTIARQGGIIQITYHSTVIVAVANDGSVVLDSGGWRTSTTKTRMNQAAHQFDLGFSVFQKDHDWYVKRGETVTPFVDGMRLEGVSQ